MSPLPAGSPLTLIQARTLTQDAARPQAQGVLVGGGRVLALGQREDLLAQAPRAGVLDHRDLILTPGLADAHIHLVMYGASLRQLTLQGTRSVAEITARVAERAARTPAGQWIEGGGFLMSELGLTEYPAAALLDEVSPHHPVALYSRDHHLLWVNSLALRLAGVSEDTPQPEGGHIARPLGTLLEAAATRLITRAMPVPSAEDLLRAARAGAEDLAARGYVSAHTMAAEDPEMPLALQTLAARGELPLRIWACLPHARLHLARELGVGPGSGGLFEFGGVKFFADGALGSRTAWLHAPGFADGTGTGIAIDPPDLIRERGAEALELGFIPVTHAIGDRANTEVLNVYGSLRDLAAQKGRLLRIEHAQHLRPQDIPRFAGLTASVQPLHLQADALIVRELLPALTESSYPFRSLQEAGAVLAFGSDAPVMPPDVQANFAAATTRLAEGGEPLAAREALSLEGALWAHTRGPALAAGWDDEGIIRPGARAAFTLWDRIGGNARALVL